MYWPQDTLRTCDANSILSAVRIPCGGILRYERRRKRVGSSTILE